MKFYSTRQYEEHSTYLISRDVQSPFSAAPIRNSLDANFSPEYRTPQIRRNSSRVENSTENLSECKVPKFASSIELQVQAIPFLRRQVTEEEVKTLKYNSSF